MYKAMFRCIMKDPRNTTNDGRLFSMRPCLNLRLAQDMSQTNQHFQDFQAFLGSLISSRCFEARLRLGTSAGRVGWLGGWVVGAQGSAAPRLDADGERPGLRAAAQRQRSFRHVSVGWFQPTCPWDVFFPLDDGFFWIGPRRIVQLLVAAFRR